MTAPAGGAEAPEDRSAARQALDLFAELIELPAGERARFMQVHCAGKPALRAFLERLLAADARPQGVLDMPPPPVGHVPGDAIGAWCLGERLGEGGMGVVFRAERIFGGFAQRAALKLIRAGIDDETARRRFVRERDLLAALDHPGIARVLDGGVTDKGAPWYAMALVDGAPIDHWCDERRLGLRARVELLAEVCAALQAAHQRLIVHCDLKPSNLLVTAAGQAVVLDFGIARLLADDGSSVTGTSALLLTPAYAAPEQIRGEALTPAVDVFAIGVLGYELLCGLHPFVDVGQSPFDLQRAIVDHDPRRLSQAFNDSAERANERAQLRSSHPSRLKRELTGDLQRVLAHCLCKDPARRYGSMAELRADLLAWLAARPISLRPEFGYRLRRFLWRQRYAVVAGAVSVAALLAATWVSLQQAALARAEQATAQSVRQLLRDIFTDVDPYRYRRGELTVRQLLDSSTARIDRDLALRPTLHALMLSDLGRAYFNAVDQQHGLDLLQRAWELAQSLSGLNHDERLGIAVAYGSALLSMGRAEQLRPVADWIEQQPVASTEGSDLWFDEQMLRLALADAEVRTPALERLIARADVVVDPARRNSASRLLAAGLGELGQFERARAIWHEIVESEQAHGTPVAQARAWHNLALALTQADPPASLAAAQAGIALYTQELGADHAYTLNLRNIRAGLLVSSGDLAAADSEFEQVIAVQRKLEGVHVIASLINFSFVLRSRFAYHRALALAEDAIALAQAQGLAATSDLLGGARFGRAEALVGLDDPAGAVLLDEIIAEREAAGGSLLAPLQLKAKWALQRGDARAALAAVDRAQPMSAPKYIEARLQLLRARALRQLGEATAAQQAIDAAQAILLQRADANDAWPALAALEQAWLLQAAPMPDEASIASLRKQAHARLAALNVDSASADPLLAEP